MTSNVYALYNSYLGVYEAPFFQQLSKADICEGYRRLVLSDPQKAYEKRLHECRLMYLGTWDDVKGLISVTEAPQAVIEIASFFPRGFIAKRAVAEEQADIALADIERDIN